MGAVDISNRSTSLLLDADIYVNSVNNQNLNLTSARVRHYPNHGFKLLQRLMRWNRADERGSMLKLKNSDICFHIFPVRPHLLIWAVTSNLKFQPSIDNIQKLIQNLDVKNEVKTRNQKAFSQMQNYNDRNQKKIKLYKENYNYLENFES